MAAVLFLLGGALVTAGIALIYVPAAVIVAGLMFLFAGYDLVRPAK